MSGRPQLMPPPDRQNWIEVAPKDPTDENHVLAAQHLTQLLNSLTIQERGALGSPLLRAWVTAGEDDALIAAIGALRG